MELTDYQKEIALEIMQAENKGQKIKEIRGRNNITQSELARRLGYNGPSTVADIETGRRNNITVDSLMKYEVCNYHFGKRKRRKENGPWILSD